MWVYALGSACSCAHAGDNSFSADRPWKERSSGCTSSRTFSSLLRAADCQRLKSSDRVSGGTGPRMTCFSARFGGIVSIRRNVCGRPCRWSRSPPACVTVGCDKEERRIRQTDTTTGFLPQAFRSRTRSRRQMAGLAPERNWGEKRRR